MLPLLSRNQDPLVEPDPKSAFVFQASAELLDYLGIDMSVAQKNVERLGLIVRQWRASWHYVVNSSVRMR